MSKVKPKSNCRWLEEKDCFEFRFRYKGKRYSCYGKTEDEAIERGYEKKKQLESGIDLRKNRITLEQYYTEMWKPEQEKTVKPATMYAYSKSWIHINAGIGAMQIKDITKLDVTRLQKQIASSGSQDTANRCLRLVKQILKVAVMDRIIDYNPAAAVKPYKVERKKATETNHRALTAEEVAVFMKYAKDSHYYDLFRFLLCTGCRISEALALKWFDVHGDIRIHKTVTRSSGKGYEISDTPKTDSSRRTIRMNDEIKEILRSQKTRNAMLFVTTEWVFPNSRGGMANYNSVDVVIANILKKINEDGIRFEHFSAHAFRDTFSTRCYESGMDIITLMSFTGHKNDRMLKEIYVQVSGEKQKEALDRVDFGLKSTKIG